MAQNLKDFLEHFELAYMDVDEGREQERKLHRMSDTPLFKITQKVLNLQHHSRSRYDSTDYFRFNNCNIESRVSARFFQIQVNVLIYLTLLFNASMRVLE